LKQQSLEAGKTARLFGEILGVLSIGGFSVRNYRSNFDDNEHCARYECEGLKPSLFRRYRKIAINAATIPNTAMATPGGGGHHIYLSSSI
jgi:hypothetical protein